MTANYVAILPSIYPPYTDACIQSAKLDNLIVHDNTVENLGIAGGWNIGVRAMSERDADWLIIISAAVRFGEPGGLDLVAHLEANPDALCVEADKCSTPVCGHDTQDFGWHLIAVHRRVFDAIGRFDENFWPCYLEETDFIRRMTLHFKDEDWSGPSTEIRHPRTLDRWPIVPVDGTLEWLGHGVDKAGVSHRQNQDNYWASKWGGPPTEARWSDPFHEERWTYPFNNPENSLGYWPVTERDVTNWRR